MRKGWRDEPWPNAEQYELRFQDFLKTIRYLIVDEYQNVDDLQEKLIACIARAGANFCVVGGDGRLSISSGAATPAI